MKTANMLTATIGIGLHIYGKNNNITQAGNIFSNGAGGVGVNNTITIPKDTEIHADGSDSDGVLTEGIEVSGNVNVEGSTAAAKNILPDETMTILTADTITGNLKNSSTAEKISGMLSAAGKIENNQIFVTAKAENNLGELNSEQMQTFIALNSMNANLQNDGRKSELRTIYNLDGETAKNALEQIGNSDASQMMSVAQQNSVANRVISDRLATAFSMQDFNFNVGENNFWIKFTKNWGELRGGANYHGQAISGGYDTRFGIYVGFHKNVDDAFIYIDGGKICNKLTRNISSLLLSTDAKYNSNIFEIGGEYKRNFSTGNYAARIGVKHAFTGANPELNFNYEGDANNSYTLKNNQDKTHLIISLNGENEFAKNWLIGGDIQFQKGRHDRDLSASIMLRKVW